MSYCKRIQMDCIYVDRDNKDDCSLNECKYMIKLKYRKDGSFETKSIKITKNKNKSN